MRIAKVVLLTLVALAAGETVAAQTGGSTASRDAAERRMILRKNENLTLTFSGRLHRMVSAVGDGANTDLFFTDSEQGPTMLRFDALGQPDDALSLGATIETGVRENRPFQVSQDNPAAGTSVNVRIAEAFVNPSSVGKFSLGRGFAAAWLAPEMDLSGTQFASLLPVGMLAPGMKFVDRATDSLSDIRVRTYFVDVERLLLVDRGRYDSPRFGPGLQVSGSIAHDSRWDLALRVKPASSGGWTFVGGGSYQDKPFAGIERRWDAAASVRHDESGFNVTVGGGNDRFVTGREARTWLVKAGWLADLVSLGKTAFSVDYYKVSDTRLSGDEGHSVGAFAVQKWPDYGLDFYAGYRRYSVDRPDLVLEDLHVLSMGAAFNF